jgi:ferrous iron transport protein A
MTLSELRIGEVAIVEQVQAGPDGQALISRLAAMGITATRSVSVLRKANLGGPLHVCVGGTTEVAIRRREADSIILGQPVHHLKDC